MFYINRLSYKRNDFSYERFPFCIYIFLLTNLNLPGIPTEEAKERTRRAVRAGKLMVGNHIVLLHPLTLDNWESVPQNLQNVFHVDIERYFDTSEYSV